MRQYSSAAFMPPVADWARQRLGNELLTNTLTILRTHCHHRSQGFMQKQYRAVIDSRIFSWPSPGFQLFRELFTQTWYDFMADVTAFIFGLCVWFFLGHCCNPLLE